MTLVLDESASPVQSLWGILDTERLELAREALRQREDIPIINSKHIRAWTRGEPPLDNVLDLPEWAQSKHIDSVVWTALPPKFDGHNRRVPTAEDVVAYLGGLTGAEREKAEAYIRSAPEQIDTVYRRRIQALLKWTPHSQRG